MKKAIFAIGLCMGTFTTQAIAEEGRSNIGISTYTLVVNEKIGLANYSYTWSGTAITGGYDITDTLAVNGSLYSLEELADSNSTMKGFDASLRFGPNGLGFTYYGSLGLYSETWKQSVRNLSERHTGGLIGGGFGYNWKDVNLNWNVISFRTAGDYKASTSSANKFSAGTGSISVGYRF